LRKIIKSSNTEQVNTFRLHYFPSIPAPHAGDEGAVQGSSAPGAGNLTVSAATVHGSRSLTPEDQLRLKEEEIHRQAYEKGLRKGQEDGRIAAQEKTAPLITTLQTTLAELDGVRNRIKQQLEREVVELAMHVARKVIQREVAISDDAIIGVVKEAMAQLDDPEKISIRLNPLDLKRLREAGERSQAAFENFENIHFEEDAGIESGGCYIHTEYGEVDARLEEQLRYIEEALRAEMRSTIAEQR
jgi:flagellar assembly protein FliH